MSRASDASLAEKRWTMCAYLCWAGEVPSVWRYYEGVPDDMASLRTPEAAVIADRHLWYA